MAPAHVASFRLMPARTSRQNHNAVAHGYRDFPPKMRKVPLPHEGQFVVRARMEIVPPFEEQLTDKAATTPIGANGDFRV